MNWKDYIAPTIFGISFLLVSIIFSSSFVEILKINNFSGEIFSFSSTLFGLILTAYSMLFGVIPALNKEFRKWTVLKDINSYFLSCLALLLINILFSLIYMFIQPYWIFSVNITLLGIDIGFFGYIIFLVKDIFQFVSQEGS